MLNLHHITPTPDRFNSVARTLRREQAPAAEQEVCVWADQALQDMEGRSKTQRWQTARQAFDLIATRPNTQGAAIASAVRRLSDEQAHLIAGPALKCVAACLPGPLGQVLATTGVHCLETSKLNSQLRSGVVQIARSFISEMTWTPKDPIREALAKTVLSSDAQVSTSATLAVLVTALEVASQDGKPTMPEVLRQAQNAAVPMLTAITKNDIFGANQAERDAAAQPFQQAYLSWERGAHPLQTRG